MYTGGIQDLLLRERYPYLGACWHRWSKRWGCETALTGCGTAEVDLGQFKGLTRGQIRARARVKRHRRVFIKSVNTRARVLTVQRTTPGGPVRGSEGQQKCWFYSRGSDTCAYHII